MNFADRLKELRTMKGVYQEDIANYLGVTRQAVSQYERGEREPDLETLEKLADYFNVDMNYILGKDNRSTYFIDPEVAEIANFIHQNPEYKTMFEGSKKLKKDDLHFVIDMIERMS